MRSKIVKPLGMPRSDAADQLASTDLAELADLAVELARAAGDLALAGRAGVVTASGAKSSPTDLVTEYDRAAEALIVDRLRQLRPDDSILGEEGTTIVGSSGLEWCIDPIDGTTNYVYDLPTWSTSVAVLADGSAQAGAVYAPALGEMFAARLGGGATLNGRPIRCSREDDLAHALVSTGFGYRPDVRTAQAERIAGLISSIRDIRRFGSAAIDLCHVAAGRVDAYFEEHLNPWDAAAGELIAREAGAVSSDFAGGPARPEELVVAGPGIHAALVDLIAAVDGG